MNLLRRIVGLFRWSSGLDEALRGLPPRSPAPEPTPEDQAAARDHLRRVARWYA